MYRWNYTPGMRSEIGQFTVVVSNLPAGGHTSRTPLVKKEGNDFWLYITIGSGGNVDKDYSRAKMMRYNVTDPTKQVKKYF